jgi:alpha-1,3/alpha-1,6-mannosyltransferase
VTRSLDIAILHPELGVGGAERLILDAALGLQARGHRVTLFTTRFPRHHSFPEANDGTLDLRVFGRFLPVHVFQRLRAPCAIARVAFAAAHVARERPPFDAVLCDLVAHAIPVLRALGPAPVVFYCHFPDRLLAPAGRSALYRFYRGPIDRLEARGIEMADRVLVNSRFTAAAVATAFPSLDEARLEVLHPGVDCPAGGDGSQDTEESASEAVILLCIARFDPAKNEALAVEALAVLRQRLEAQEFAKVELIIAGGYDPRLRENAATLEDLERRTRRLGLEGHVRFLKSPSDAQRQSLLRRCRCVVHPVPGEHFGLVPVEAMAAGRPVVAVEHGGPAETIRQGATGFLCPPTGDAFANALVTLVREARLAARMGRQAREHVAHAFSRETFERRLDEVMRTVASRGPGARGNERMEPLGRGRLRL